MVSFVCLDFIQKKFGTYFCWEWEHILYVYLQGTIRFLLRKTSRFSESIISENNTFNFDCSQAQLPRFWKTHRKMIMGQETTPTPTFDAFSVSLLVTLYTL